MDNPIFVYFVTLTIFSLMFAIGVSHSLQQLTSLARQPALLFRSLLAVIVLVPVIVGLLLWQFTLPAAVAAGLAVLAAAPGAPLTTKRTEMAGGEPSYATSLQLTLALLAVLVTPLILATYFALFRLTIEVVAPLHVARQIAQVTFLPVIIGLLLQHAAPAFAERIRNPVRVLANVLLVLLVVVLIVFLAMTPTLRAMLNLGWPSTAAIIVMVTTSLAVGHLLGGPTQEKRAVLAIACIARNVGLAVFIAGLTNYGQQFIPTLLAYMILGGVLAVPYAVWSKRRIKLRGAA